MNPKILYAKIDRAFIFVSSQRYFVKRERLDYLPYIRTSQAIRENCLLPNTARTSALSIPWNNIHIAVGGIVTLSAMFTSGSRPISAKPSSLDVRRSPLDHTKGSDDEVLLLAFLRSDNERCPDVSVLRFNLHSPASLPRSWPVPRIALPDRVLVCNNVTPS